MFGVTGGNCLYLSDAIHRREGMKYFGMHGERDAGYAAIGYAKQSGELGCVLVTTGCGSTNVVTPLLSAWQDSVPLIVLAGNAPAWMLGGLGRQSGTQGADICRIVGGLVKAYCGISRPIGALKVGPLLDAATEHRRGPVWISVPLDVQSASLERG